jgi:hypothetical protein
MMVEMNPSQAKGHEPTTSGSNGADPAELKYKIGWKPRPKVGSVGKSPAN